MSTHQQFLRDEDELPLRLLLVAYGVLILPILGSIYSASSEVYRYWFKDLASFKRLELLRSESHWVLIGPPLDAMVISLVILMIYISYYYVISRQSTRSRRSYNSDFLLLDLMQVVVIYFTTQSLDNFSTKLSSGDTVWFGLMGMFFLSWVRPLRGVSFFRDPAVEYEIVPLQDLLLRLVRVSHASAFCFAFSLFGARYDRYGSSIEDTLWNIVDSVLVYLGMTLVSMFSLRFARTASPNVHFNWLWDWPRSKEALSFALGAGLSLVLLLVLWNYWSEAHLIVMRTRNLVPLSIPVAIGATWLLVRFAPPLSVPFRRWTIERAFQDITDAILKLGDRRYQSRLGVATFLPEISNQFIMKSGLNLTLSQEEQVLKHVEEVYEEFSSSPVGWVSSEGRPPIQPVTVGNQKVVVLPLFIETIEPGPVCLGAVCIFENSDIALGDPWFLTYLSAMGYVLSDELASLLEVPISGS